MGAVLEKKYVNFGLTAVFDCKRQVKSVSNAEQFKAYQSHYFPEKYLAATFSMKHRGEVPQSDLGRMLPNKPQALSLLTYNVWFQEHNVASRNPCILRMLAESDADVICLQEVNAGFLNELHGALGKLAQKQDHFIPIIQMHWYDTVILSKYPCRFYKKVFEKSSMGRCVLTAVLEFATSEGRTFKLAINCVHLESLDSESFRMQQLEEIKVLNKEMDMVVIAGDFNFTDGSRENKCLEGWVDVWKTGKRHFSKWSNEEMRELGYTMPQSRRFSSWRPDHVVYQRKQQAKEKDQASEIAIIGDFTIPPFENDHFTHIAKDDVVRTPSDHFGLISKLYL